MLMQPVADRLEAVRHDQSGGRSRARARLGRQAERFRMGPAVVPGQDLMRLPGRYATVRWQIWQRVTGSWVTVTGKREGDLLICLHDAKPRRSDLALLVPHALHAAMEYVQRLAAESLPLEAGHRPGTDSQGRRDAAWGCAQISWCYALAGSFRLPIRRGVLPAWRPETAAPG